MFQHWGHTCCLIVPQLVELGTIFFQKHTHACHVLLDFGQGGTDCHEVVGDGDDCAVEGLLDCPQFGFNAVREGRLCCEPLINVPYIRIFGAPDQGQTLDVQESQTAKSALRDHWTRNVPHHTLEVVLEVTLEHMCTGLRP